MDQSFEEQRIMKDVVYHNPEIRHRYFLIIPPYDGSDFRALVRPNKDHWTLPFFEPTEHHYAVVNQIHEYTRQKLQLTTSTLRCLYTSSGEDGIEYRYYALDNLQPGWEPPRGMRWVSEDQARRIKIGTEEQREVLLNWFDWIHSDSSLRAPWMRRGWFDFVSDWMLDLADRMSMEDLGEVEQLRAWARSSTTRLSTGEGKLYLKAVSDVFSYEPVVTRVLSIRYPGHAPDVRAVHVEKGWMLTREFDGTPLRGQTDFAVWERTLRQYAEMQIDLISSTPSLISLGVPDRNVDYLASQIDRLMNDLPNTLTLDERLNLKKIASQLRTMCFELIDKNVPLTLTHGDLWSGNIIIRNNGDALFFDWSDASISHPFFDVPMLLAEIEDELPGIPDVRERLTRTYLQPWTRLDSFNNLRAAYSLAETLTYLHQAMFYYVHILPGIEGNTRWEMQHMLPALLRQILILLNPASAQQGSRTTRLHTGSNENPPPGTGLLSEDSGVKPEEEVKNE
jgi:hypothetical protein